MIVLTAAGIFAYFNLGRGEDPPFTIKQMVVSADWPGATAREMAQQVTDKLETKLQELPYFDNVQSYTKPGETVIFVSLRDDAPPAKVPDLWYQVRKKVGDIQRHPAGGRASARSSTTSSATPTASSTRFEADGFSLRRAQGRSSRRARQRLLRVPDVAKVDLFGVQDEKIYIEFANAARHAGRAGRPDPRRRAPAERDRARRHVRDQGRARVVRVDGAPVSAEQLRGAAASAPTAARSRLGDIADDQARLRRPAADAMRFKGKEVIGLGVVDGRPAATSSDLGKALDAAMAEHRGATCRSASASHRSPTSPRWSTSRSSEFIHVARRGGGDRAGGVLPQPGLCAPASSWRCRVPLVLAMTFVGMMLLGIDLHKISLGALILALGLLVDDAIIAVEMMVVKMEQGCQPAARRRPSPTPRPRSRC